MKVFFHFSVTGFSNSYLIGPEDGGDAVLIDPGIMDVELVDLIEKNRYYLKWVLVTHNHESHVKGLKTLKKIYNAQVFANSPHILDIASERVVDGQILDLGFTSVSVLELSGHSSDSVVYRISAMIFTGDILGAGTIGSTPNSYAKALLIRNITDKLLTLGDRTYIFPGHGPPSTVMAERQFNPFLTDQIRKPV